MKREILSYGIELYCADCRDIIPGLVDIGAVVSDPPFGMEFQSNHRSVSHMKIANDDQKWPLTYAAAIPAAHSSYVFCRWDNLPDVPKPKSVITWVKNNWSMGDLAHEHGRQTELALFYPGPGHFFPAGRPPDVIEAPKTGNEHHPTEKPVQLMEAIVRWTDGTVVDPFMGSGSTGIACARLGRKFVGVEISSKYFETAIRRISDELKRPRLDLEPRVNSVQEALL